MRLQRARGEIPRKTWVKKRVTKTTNHKQLTPEVREQISYFRRLSVIAADEGDEWRSDAHWEYAEKLKRDAMEALDDE